MTKIHLATILFGLFPMLSIGAAPLSEQDHLVVNDANIMRIDGRETLCIKITNISLQTVRFSTGDISYASGCFAAAYIEPWGRENLPRLRFPTSPSLVDLSIKANESKVFQFKLDLIFELPPNGRVSRKMVVFYFFEVALLVDSNPSESGHRTIAIGGYCRGED